MLFGLHLEFLLFLVRLHFQAATSIIEFPPFLVVNKLIVTLILHSQNSDFVSSACGATVALSDHDAVCVIITLLLACEMVLSGQ